MTNAFILGALGISNTGVVYCIVVYSSNTITGSINWGLTAD